MERPAPWHRARRILVNDGMAYLSMPTRPEHNMWLSTTKARSNVAAQVQCTRPRPTAASQTVDDTSRGSGRKSGIAPPVRHRTARVPRGANTIEVTRQFASQSGRHAKYPPVRSSSQRSVCWATKARASHVKLQPYCPHLFPCSTHVISQLPPHTLTSHAFMPPNHLPLARSGLYEPASHRPGSASLLKAVIRTSAGTCRCHSSNSLLSLGECET